MFVSLPAAAFAEQHVVVSSWSAPSRLSIWASRAFGSAFHENVELHARVAGVSAMISFARSRAWKTDAAGC